MKRRDFIRTGTAGAITLSFADVLAMYDQINPGDIPTRILGRTGEKLSIVGFGGIALRNNGPEFAGELVPRAYHAGIKYFDVAPGYGDAQELMGPPLEPYRKDVFLACKTMMRDREGAERELAESLKLLRTDHFDLYQFHAMSSMDDVEKVFGRDGAMEAFLKARRDGKIRYIGFSAHNEEVALKMMDLFDFDSILYPINCVCWENGDFGPRVFRTAREKGMGVLALKAVAKTGLPKGVRPYPNMWYMPFGEDREIDLALSFTLSKDVTATVHAGDSLFQKKTLEFVRKHRSIEVPDGKAVEAMVRGVEPIFRHPAV